MRASGRHRYGRFPTHMLVALVALATLASCSTMRASLGTTDGGCFLALPAAGGAVHHRGHLLGARLVDTKTLARDSTMRDLVSSAPGPSVRRVCLVAFGGSFDAADVASPAGRSRGPIAVVVVEYPHTMLLGTVILLHLPEGFGHGHIGGG